MHFLFSFFSSIIPTSKTIFVIISVLVTIYSSQLQIHHSFPCFIIYWIWTLKILPASLLLDFVDRGQWRDPAEPQQEEGLYLPYARVQVWFCCQQVGVWAAPGVPVAPVAFIFMTLTELWPLLPSKFYQPSVWLLL